jgi:NCS1 family nucleobase:cation symporter-1
MTESTAVEAGGTPVAPSGTPGEVRAGYNPRLTNSDLAPLKKQTWKSYNFFAFWMSDVHSVGGYVTAGSLFALGLAAWQVLIALVVGIGIVYFLCNLVARPSQATGTPYRWSSARRSVCAAPTSRRSSVASSPSPGTASRPTWRRSPW